MARGVLDRHVRPGAADHDRVDAEPLEQDVQARLEEAVHPHLLDDVVPLLGLEAVGRRGAPRAANERVRIPHALEQRGVLLQAGGARLDDVPDVDHRGARLAEGVRQPGDVRDHVLRRRVRGRAGVGERAALDDHVVLEILDDQGGRPGVEPQHCVGHAVTSCSGAGCPRRRTAGGRPTLTRR